MKSKITKNYLYNLTYQLFLIVIPVFVTPYVARILGDVQSGYYSFSYSIVSYFILLASLGFGYYAQREIAKYQNDKTKQSISFWEITIVKFFTMLLSLVLYLVIVKLGLFGQQYTSIMLVLSLDIIATAFDITFMFRGNENFKTIVIRNIAIKILTIICIFTLVKDANDLWKYALIESTSILLGNLVLWFSLKNSIARVKLKELRPIRHLVPALILFLPSIAVSIYTSLDKTLIGLITHSGSENGNYEYAEKIVKMTLTFVTSLGAVMIPRNSQIHATHGHKSLEHNIHLSQHFVFLFGIPLAFGCAIIADNYIPWYLGPDYTKAATLMKLLSPLIVIIGLNNLYGLQFLIPTNKDKKFTFAILCGACINFTLDILLINLFQSYGAAIATIIAETVVTIIMGAYVSHYINNKHALRKSFKPLLAGIIMYAVGFCLSCNLSPSVFHTIILVASCATVYTVSIAILKDELFQTITHKITTLIFKHNSKKEMKK